MVQHFPSHSCRKCYFQWRSVWSALSRGLRRDRQVGGLNMDTTVGHVAEVLSGLEWGGHIAPYVTQGVEGTDWESKGLQIIPIDDTVCLGPCGHLFQNPATITSLRCEQHINSQVLRRSFETMILTECLLPKGRKRFVPYVWYSLLKIDLQHLLLKVNR